MAQKLNDSIKAKLGNCFEVINEEKKEGEPNKVKWQKQLLTSLTHTDEQYNNFKVSLFGDEPITIYHSQLRQLLREVRDKEKML